MNAEKRKNPAVQYREYAAPTFRRKLKSAIDEYRALENELKRAVAAGKVSEKVAKARLVLAEADIHHKFKLQAHEVRARHRALNTKLNKKSPFVHNANLHPSQHQRGR